MAAAQTLPVFLRKPACQSSILDGRQHSPATATHPFPGSSPMWPPGLARASAADALIAEFRARLKALPKVHGEQAALYLARSGVTTGPGTLIHTLLTHAGYENYQQAPGWRSLPLEKMATDPPDLIITSFYDTDAPSPNSWTAAHHPIARSLIADKPVIPSLAHGPHAAPGSPSTPLKHWRPALLRTKTNEHARASPPGARRGERNRNFCCVPPRLNPDVC